MPEDKTPAHTPGKLTIHDLYPEAIHDSTGRMIANCRYTRTEQEGRANAIRFVACVNACADIERPENIAELVRVAAKIGGYLQGVDARDELAMELLRAVKAVRHTSKEGYDEQPG